MPKMRRRASRGGRNAIVHWRLDGATPARQLLVAFHHPDSLFARPGELWTQQTPNGIGYALLSSDGGAAYLRGEGLARDFRPQPFVDRIEIRTGTKTRLFTSAGDSYERIVAPLNADFSAAIVSRESPTEVEQYYHRDLSSGAEVKLTNNRDYAPEITNAQKQMIQVSRPDGYRFWVNVTLPQDWKPGTRLPAIFWFYPREYTDQDEYDEGFQSYNKNDFPGVGARSMDILTLLGYAVVEPDLPIVGPEGQMNDEYPHDLRTTLSAVIDTVSARGWVDRNRLGLGGHSYGAFGTANPIHALGRAIAIFDARADAFTRAGPPPSAARRRTSE